MPWKEASGGYAESFSPAEKKVAFNNYHHLWILVVIWCYDWHSDAAVSTASLAVKRLCVQFQLDGFYVLLVSVGLGGGVFSRYSWLRIQDNRQEPDHQYWQPNPNLLKRDKKKWDLKCCIRSRRTEVTSAQRLAATSKVASEFMRARQTNSKCTQAFQFTTSLQKKKRKADLNAGMSETALFN